MTTWGDLRDRVVEALGEFDDQAAAGTVGATYADALIYKRMGEKYAQLVTKASRKDPTKFASVQAFTYTADAEYVDAEALPPESLRWRRIIRLEDRTRSDYPVVIKAMSEREWRGTIDPFATFVSPADRVYFLQGERLHLWPKPVSALSLVAVYVPATERPTTDDSADEPLLLPDEYHELIALEAAISFRGAFGDVTQELLLERQELHKDFMAWASGSLEAGPRYVHEVE